MSSLCREFEGTEYLRKKFMSYMPNKIDSDEKYVALYVDETEQ